MIISRVGHIDFLQLAKLPIPPPVHPNLKLKKNPVIPKIIVISKSMEFWNHSEQPKVPHDLSVERIRQRQRDGSPMLQIEKRFKAYAMLQIKN